jgi:hypothetical protein
LFAFPWYGPGRPLAHNSGVEHSPTHAVRVYPFAMIQLPASYQEYLFGKSESFINAVRPVLMQSAADKSHGVRVVFHPHDHQAHVDETIPFGTILEDID